jgi:hypothetical protein
MSQNDGGVPRKTAKQRVGGIPLDYYKQPDRLTRWKIGLSAAAVVVAVGWWASGWALAGRGRGQLRYSHGPVARVHATWDAQCAACHVDFRPISGGASWAGALGVETKAGDAKCMACHAGPPHHDNQVEAEVKSCAGCHRDHRGRDASLVRLPDSDCTSCHAGLASHTKGGQTDYKDVSAFDRDHPEFAVLRDAAKDPGKLKFNHALHMTPGMNPVDKGKPVWLVGQIADKDERERYRLPKQTDNDPVTLDCQSCHQADGGNASAASLARLPASLKSPRGDGAYMMPIVYEKHCAACHALEVPGRKGADGDRRDDPDAAPLKVPHRIQPAELHQELEGLYLARALAEKPEAKGDAEPKGRSVFHRQRALPTKSPDDVERIWRSVQEDVKDAEKVLVVAGEKRTCTECHYFRDKEGKEVAIPGAGTSLSEYKVVPPGVPATWFQHATFDHAAHRAVSCKECHAGAYSAEAKASAASRPSWTQNEEVMLPKVETCKQCHIPTTRTGDMVLGGAGHECTECHTYHHGPGKRADLARGLGAPARDRAEMSLAEFLGGTGTPKPAATAPEAK